MKRSGAIINNGSVTGLQGSKERIDYSMTKGGIHAFTRPLSSFSPLRTAQATSLAKSCR